MKLKEDNTGSGTLPWNPKLDPWNPKLDQVVKASPGKIPKSSDQVVEAPADSSKKDAVLGKGAVVNPLRGYGKRKSRRNRKTKKSRKSKTRKNGRKSNRRR
jgi:hypothetical protein